MKKIGIIGFGRFGELLARLGSATFDISVVESNPSHQRVARSAGYKVIPFEGLAEMDFIFLAVPISALESVLVRLAPLVTTNHVVIDLCSVKVYPVQLMERYLPHTQILATHPLFGPDSAKKGLEGLQVAFCPISVNQANLQILTDFWTKQGVLVQSTTPEAHDQDTVYSQALTYTIAKIINTMDIPDITFTTRSFNAITEVATLSANDTEQLFHDMFFYNPYLSQMKSELEASLKKTNHILDAITDEQASRTLHNSSS